MTTLERLAELDRRLAAKIEITDDGCWLWTGAIGGGGYGYVGRTDEYGRRTRFAHRRTARLLRWADLNELPGLGAAEMLDHICRVRRCVNPWHLRRLTCRENVNAGINGVIGEHSSPYFGIYWNTESGKWLARIRSDGCRYHLGYFSDQKKAAHTYDAACVALGSDPANYQHRLVDRYPNLPELAVALSRIYRPTIAPSPTTTTTESKGEP